MSLPSSPARLDRFAPAPGCLAHKFGGSSLVDAGRFRQAIRLLDTASPRIVVVSAMQGVTDALVALAAAAYAGQAWMAGWTALRQRHLQTASALDGDDPGLDDWLVAQFEALRLDLERANTLVCVDTALAARVHGLAKSGRPASCTPPRWRGRRLAMLDAREVLVVHEGELGTLVDWNDTREHLAAWQARQDPSLLGDIEQAEPARP